MENDLSFLLSTIELVANVELGSETLDHCESKILKEQPKWQAYLEQQSILLQEAIKVFKAYDTSGCLKHFWQMLKNKKIRLGSSNFKKLMKVALLAYDRDVLEDAYKMFCFISTYYSRHYKVYLYLGSVVQSLHGFEEASSFFKTTTSVFPEPDLLFLAAENEIQRENSSGARDYLQKAEDIFSERAALTEEENELKTRIEEILTLLK